jgi:hypothetical protein
MRWVLFAITVSGLAGVAFFSYFTLQDWAALQKNYAQFAQLAPQSPTGAILLADARQNMHRITCSPTVRGHCSARSLRR